VEWCWSEAEKTGPLSGCLIGTSVRQGVWSVKRGFGMMPPKELSTRSLSVSDCGLFWTMGLFSLEIGITSLYAPAWGKKRIKCNATLEHEKGLSEMHMPFFLFHTRRVSLFASITKNTHFTPTLPLPAPCALTYSTVVSPI